MTKADKLRAAMRDAGKNGITLAEVVIIAQSPGSISNMLKTGEVVRDIDTGQTRFKLNPDYTPARQRKLERTLPIKRKKATKRAKSTKRHPRKVRTFKDIVDKHIPESRTDALARLALQNLIASAEGLAAIVRDQVEGIDNNPQLKTQLESSERAAQLARLV